VRNVVFRVLPQSLIMILPTAHASDAQKTTAHASDAQKTTAQASDAQKTTAQPRPIQHALTKSTFLPEREGLRAIFLQNSSGG